MHTHTHTLAHTHTHAYTHTYTHAYTHAYTHTYTHAYTHTYTHGYTHIHTYKHKMCLYYCRSVSRIFKGPLPLCLIHHKLLLLLVFLHFWCF